MLLLFLPTPCCISSSTCPNEAVFHAASFPSCSSSSRGDTSQLMDATSSLPHFVEHVQQPALKAARASNGSTPVTAPARMTHGLAWQTRSPPPMRSTPPPVRSTRGRVKSRWKTPARPQVRLLLWRQRLELLLLCRLLLRSEVPHVGPLRR
jgi:hypothetical protein